MGPSRSIRQDLVLSWCEHWPYFKLSVFIFILGGILGVTLFVADVDLFAAIGLETQDEVFPEEITTMTILLNNTLVFVLALVGLMSFGLLTVAILLMNGVLVGYVVTPAILEVGIDFVIVAIVPHGIFELPAFFVATAVTFKLLHRFFDRIRDRRESFLEPGEVRRIGLLLVVAWLVLAFAAAIEAMFTLWLVETLYPEFPDVATG